MCRMHLQAYMLVATTPYQEFVLPAGSSYKESGCVDGTLVFVWGWLPAISTPVTISSSVKKTTPSPRGGDGGRAGEAALLLLLLLLLPPSLRLPVISPSPSLTFGRTTCCCCWFCCSRSSAVLPLGGECSRLSAEAPFFGAPTKYDDNVSPQ